MTSTTPGHLRVGDTVNATIFGATVVNVTPARAGDDRSGPTASVRLTAPAGNHVLDLPLDAPAVAVTRMAPPELNDLHPGDLYADADGRLHMWANTAGVTGAQHGFVAADENRFTARVLTVEEFVQLHGPVERVFAAPRPAAVMTEPGA